MTLIVDTNSYVSLADAETYFETRIDADAWDSATNAVKESALVTAALYLNDVKWTGSAVSETQPLAFPRDGSYFDPHVGASVVLSEDAVPTRVLTANYELAYHLMNNDGLLDNTGLVEELAIGSIKLKKVDAPDTLPGVVQRVIRPLLVNGGSRNWWRSN
jgi:hypothetical protein